VVTEAGVTGRRLQEVGAAGQHLLVGHPQNFGGELVGDLRAGAWGSHQHVAARDIDLAVEHSVTASPALADRDRRPR
jgi:hypothetical protein